MLSLHTIPVNMTCLPISDAYYICLLTMFVHQTNALLYPSSITYDETVTPVGYCEKKKTLLKTAVSASPRDSQETTRLDEDSECSSVVDDCIPYTTIAGACSNLVA